MAYQIDQSGKIEQTQRNSVVAIINGKSCTVFLKKKEKRTLQKIFKAAGQQRYFPFLVFAVLLAIGVKEMQIKQKVIIDQEYFGHNQFIEEHVLLYLQILEVKITPSFEFGHIGKLSKAHQLAYEVAVQKKEADITVTAEEIIKIIFGTKT